MSTPPSPPLQGGEGRRRRSDWLGGGQPALCNGGARRYFSPPCEGGVRREALKPKMTSGEIQRRRSNWLRNVHPPKPPLCKGGKGGGGEVIGWAGACPPFTSGGEGGEHKVIGSAESSPPYAEWEPAAPFPPLAKGGLGGVGREALKPKMTNGEMPRRRNNWLRGAHPPSPPFARGGRAAETR
jgi:hypothetical protein